MEYLETEINIVDEDIHLIVNSDRTITVPEESAVVGVKGDHNSNRVTFDCPRYFDEYDLTQCTNHFVAYINSAGNIQGQYIITDLAVDAVDETLLHFSWLVSGNVTVAACEIAFALCFRTVEDDLIIYQWNTNYSTGLRVIEGIEVSEDYDELYPDILAKWFEELESAAGEKLSELSEKVDELNEKAEQAATDAVSALADAKTALESLEESKTEIDVQITKINNELLQKVTKSDLDVINKTISEQDTLITQNAEAIAIKADQTVVDTLARTVSAQETQIGVNSASIALKADKTYVDTVNNTVTANSAALGIQAEAITGLVSKTDGTVADIAEIKIEADKISTAVTQMGEDIGDKITLVEQTVDSISQSAMNNESELKKQATQIKQNAAEIALRAAKSEVDVLAGTVAAQSTQITANAEEIVLKADKSTVSSLSSTVDSLSTQTASLSLSQEAFKTEVSSTYVTQTDFDALDVGGRNYIQESAFTDNTLWKFTCGTASETKSYSISDGEAVITGTTASSAYWKQYQIYSNQGATALLDLKAGETYTLVCEVYIETGTTVYAVSANLRKNPTSGATTDIMYKSADTAITGEWQTLTKTVTIPEDVYTDFSYWRIILIATASGTVRFRKPRLVKGLHYADWSPAPEDIDSSFKSLSTGGANLFNDSKGLTTWSTVSVANAVQATVTESSSPYGTAKKITMDASTTGGLHKAPVKLEIGKTYSWSVYVKANAAGTLGIGSEQGGQKTCAVSTTWARFTHTFVAATSTYYSFVFYRKSSLTELYVHSPVLVEGNIIPNWCESLNDIATQAQLTTVSNTVSSNFTQLSDLINLRVTKGDVVNQINVSTESILIAGNKVHITGETTIDSAVITSAMIKSIDASKITTGTLSAGIIGANSITADKLNVKGLMVNNGTEDTLVIDSNGNITMNDLTGRNVTINGLFATDVSIEEAIYIKSKTYGYNFKSMWLTSESGGINTLSLGVNGSADITCDSEGGITLSGSVGIADALSVNAYAAIQETLYVGGGTTLASHLYVQKSIYVGGNSTSDVERSIHLYNTGSGTYSHKCRIYGGNSESTTGIGVYDNVKGHQVWHYQDQAKVMIVNENVIFRVPNAYNTTTSNAANTYVSSVGTLLRTSSASKYKLDIADVDADVLADNILNLTPKSWYDKHSVESYSDLLTTELKGESVDWSEEEKESIKRNYGLIAEDVEAAGLGMFVTYGDDGEVEGLEYDRLWTMLIPISRRHEDKIKELEEQYAQLQTAFAQLQQSYNTLKQNQG